MQYFLTLTCLLFVTAIVAEEGDSDFSSLGAKKALRDYKKAVAKDEKAQSQQVKEVEAEGAKAAKRTRDAFVENLRKALKKSMQAGNLDEANKIDAAIKALKKGASPVGTSIESDVKNPRTKKNVNKELNQKLSPKRELRKMKLPDGDYYADFYGNNRFHPWAHIYRVKDMIFEWPFSIHKNGNRKDEKAWRGLLRGKGRFISPDRIEVLWNSPRGAREPPPGRQVWTITPTAILINERGWLMVVESNVGSLNP